MIMVEGLRAAPLAMNNFRLLYDSAYNALVFVLGLAHT